MLLGASSDLARQSLRTGSTLRVQIPQLRDRLLMYLPSTGGFDTAVGGLYDAFVTKVNASGSTRSASVPASASDLLLAPARG